LETLWHVVHGRARVVVTIWMRVRREKAAVRLCVAAGESERGDVVCA